MAVIIKGVNMPKTCAECRFFFCAPDDKDLHDQIVFMNERVKNDTGRAYGCPIEELLEPEEFARDMRECGDDTDEEKIHINADNLMCIVLRNLGYEEGVEAFEELPKWYS